MQSFFLLKDFFILEIIFFDIFPSIIRRHFLKLTELFFVIFAKFEIKLDPMSILK